MARAITSPPDHAHESLLEKARDRVQFAQRGGYNYLHPSILLARGALALIPTEFAVHLRSMVLRWAGFRIGYESVFLGTPRLSGWGNIRQKLSIGAYCSINTNCLLDLNNTITIGDHVGFGPDVMILTSTHELGPPERRVGQLRTSPVTIGNGVWIGARSVVLAGVTIGAGAVIAAGSTITRDVPPNTLFAGSPARLVQHL